jgi:hypothetical protein
VSAGPERGVIALLTAQAVAFGVMLALVVVPANALFLDAYGAKWLPATYIAIAVFGSLASALIARAARRTRLVRVATATLFSIAVLYAASWLILAAGGMWVSAALLVLFPIALQLGFVFIGGQAGRLLDVRQMKERFPRIVGGFSVGFLVGGLLAIPLLALLGSTEHLLLGTTVAQLAFLGLLIDTERRFPEVRAAPVETVREAPRPSARALFGSTLVLLLLVYQLLSAMGSWLVDYLLFNRAHEHYSGDDLTRFLSWYTAALNLADILFLALLAGPLMRRFGLRLGLVLNPAVVAALLVAMALVVAGPGAAAFGLFVLAAVTRVGDIVLTDGTTRTSVNAAFQVVPIKERLAVQTVVEGIGVPIAIGVTGAVLLVMNVLGLGIGAVIVLGVIVGVIWTASGAAMYGAYKRSLAEEMRHRSIVASDDVAEDDAALQALLRSEDARDVRLGLDLLPGTVSPPFSEALLQASDHADPEVRVRALLQLAAAGDGEAAAAAGALAHELARSGDPADRRAAAAALAARDGLAERTATMIALLDDADPAVQAAAFDAVGPDDDGDDEIVHRVVAGLEEPRTAGSATGAARRLGGAAVAPLLAAAVADGGASRRPALLRAAAEAARDHGVTVIEPALRDPDRVARLSALEALEAVDAGSAVAPALLDGFLREAAAHAARSLAARATLSTSDGSLRRALEDEIELARRLVVAALALRHGGQVRHAVQVVDNAEGQRRALGVEALDVLLTRDEAAIALPLVRRDLAPDEQAAALGSLRPPVRSRAEWVDDLAADPAGVWRSSWLALCARHTASQTVSRG